MCRPFAFDLLIYLNNLNRPICLMHPNTQNSGSTNFQWVTDLWDLLDHLGHSTKTKKTKGPKRPGGPEELKTYSTKKTLQNLWLADYRLRSFGSIESFRKDQKMQKN